MSVGIFRRTYFLSSLAAIAVLTILAVMERTTALSKPTEHATSETWRRELHILPYDHTHIYRPIYIDDATQTPTLLFDDEYYTDDGAIDATMMRDKKDLYKQERYDDNDETTQRNEPSALGSEQGLSSSATDTLQRRCVNVLFTVGINAFLAWSFFFW